MDFDIHIPSRRYIESVHELAMAKKPIESEVTFEKRLCFGYRIIKK
jgi:hypothetical protein